MTRVIAVLLCAAITCSPLISCSSGAKAAPAATKLLAQFVKNAGRNSRAVTSQMSAAGIRAAKNGRLVPVNRLAQWAKIEVPDPTRLATLLNGSKTQVSGVAKNILSHSDVDLVMYDAVGNPIVYAKPVHNAAMYGAATREFNSHVGGVIDDVVAAVERTSVTNEGQLRGAIAEAVKRQLDPTRPFIFDVSTGQLTAHVEFASGSQIVGSLNLYNALGKSVALGGGGYYVLRHS